jgi:hypothetical protein
MFHSVDGFLTCVHPWGRENKFCGCRLAEISFNGEENLLARWGGVNSKKLVQNKPQIFAEDAGRNLSKPRPGGLFGTLRRLTSREARRLHAAISTHHAQEMQKQDPPRIFADHADQKQIPNHRGHRGARRNDAAADFAEYADKRTRTGALLIKNPPWILADHADQEATPNHRGHRGARPQIS